MSLENQILEALRRAIAKAGGKPELAKKLGVFHSRINCFDNGSRKISGMTVATLGKLFPELKMYFFREDWPDANKNNFQGAHLTGVQMGNANRMGNIQVQAASQIEDESTRILMNYWRDLPQSKRFEFLARLAEIKER